MSYLYVNEQGATISVRENRLVIRGKNDLTRSIPIESLENIQIFGNVQVSSQSISTCLKKGIDLIFYSTKGSYYGRLISTNHVNVSRQRLQTKILEDENLRLDFTKKIIKAKINNQIVVLKRYKNRDEELVEASVQFMRRLYFIVNNSSSISQIMGLEGSAAREYFKCIGKIIPKDFYFEKRTKKPPRDAFNSLLSFGYSILLNEFYGKIEGRGLNPYFGIMHSDRLSHPSLASDLMEEWRAVIVDSTVLSIIFGNEISIENFIVEDKGVFLDDVAFKVFVRKLEKKLTSNNRYLKYINYPISFRRAIDMQVGQYVKFVEKSDVSKYDPVMIR